jgi:glycosyltransferase involved in cell wall biosynthesis
MVGRILHADSRKSNMKQVLWLASWYPDEMSPYNGDFIQRHAIAVSQYMPVTVVYMTQHGPDVEMPAYKTVVKNKAQLTEIIVYFPYRPTGRALFDKVRYNWQYFYYYRRFLRQYIAENGKPDLVHVHVPMKAGRMAVWLKKSLGIPFIVSEHSSAYSDEVPDNYQNRSSYYRKWVKTIFEEAEAVTTVSQKLGARLQSFFQIHKLHIIPNVADSTFFHYDPKPVQRFRLLHASTMDHPKNVEGILRTLHRLKGVRQDWECVMLGWDTPALKQLATDLGLDDHIQWKGIVPYQQVAAEMQQSSVFILFSRYENQPCVILESLSCGLPVISSAVGGIPEVVNVANGLLVEPGNEEQLLGAIINVMNENNSYDRAAIAVRAKELFSYEAVGNRFVMIYR